jgi:hypothetical protein
MGTTEESIVYQLLNIIRASELNNDEVVTERRIRSLIRVQRADIINRLSLKGLDVQDVCFQKLDPSILTELNANEYTAILPSLIYLSGNFGVRITTNEYSNIPLVNHEEYLLSKKNPINKYKPKATITNQELKVYINDSSPFSMNGGFEANQAVKSIRRNEPLIITSILDDPEDGFGYDWTKTEFPFPKEYITELKNNILRRDFQIMLSTKSDQVPNSKNDTLRYHDQDDVQR